jgi:hypothetical protein
VAPPRVRAPAQAARRSRHAHGLHLLRALPVLAALPASVPRARRRLGRPPRRAPAGARDRPPAHRHDGPAADPFSSERPCSP